MDTLFSFGSGVPLSLLFAFGLLSGFLLVFGLVQDRRERLRDRPGLSGLSSDSDVLQNLPCAVWIEQPGGLIWHNTACEGLIGTQEQFCFDMLRHVSGRFDRDKAVRVRTPNDSPNQITEYEVSRAPFQDGWIFVAQEASNLVEAENDLQRFILTLTETFAHLRIGLAIFDARRDLSLFNPALSDLLDLSPEYLARRPSLHSFLDRLRDTNTIPGQGEYDTIRKDLMELEKGPGSGGYSAEWTQPTGHVYRVNGRPHPRGGVALTFEDVSKMVVNERRYRSELSQLFSALDNLSQGIAVFDVSGELVIVNDAFDTLWGSDYGRSLTPVTLEDMVETLGQKCHPSSLWSDILHLDQTTESLVRIDGKVQTKNGAEVSIRATLISGAKLMVEVTTSAAKNGTGTRTAAA